MQVNSSHKFSNFYDAVALPRKIDFLVLHHVQADNTQHAIEQFFEHGVSAHFLIDELGEIFQLVNENDIAYHAGVSFWQGVDGLNQSSIGIEFINSNPFGKKFEKMQMKAGADLCKYLVDKYGIEAGNVVGHSDIGYERENGFLDRKQDPSQFFDWKFMKGKGIGIYPELSFKGDDEVIFKNGDENYKISGIKKSFARFGYKVSNFSDIFDDEMVCLVRVFHRRFNQNKCENSGLWYQSSQKILEELMIINKR